MTDYTDLAMPDMAADYTMTLGNLIYIGYDDDAKLHLDSYPIYDETKRSDLNHRIAAHYALREIGQETAERFVFALGRRMNEIMPYYNQLYLSALKDFDAFQTTDMVNEMTNDNTTESSAKSQADQSGTASGTSHSTSSSESHGQSVHSDLPATGTDDPSQYATSYDKTDSTGSSTTDGTTSSQNSSTSNSQTDFTHQNATGATNTHAHGYAGVPPSQLLAQWRSTMLNIDMMVVNELADLFMQVWGSGEDMTNDRMTRYTGRHLE